MGAPRFDDREQAFQVPRLSGTSAQPEVTWGGMRPGATGLEGGEAPWPTLGICPAPRMEPGGGGFPSPWPVFLPRLPEQPGSVLGPECASCKRVFSAYFQKEPVYQLPCGHLLCRPCLGEKQRSLPMMCTACQQPVASQDVLRVHF